MGEQPRTSRRWRTARETATPSAHARPCADRSPIIHDAWPRVSPLGSGMPLRRRRARCASLGGWSRQRAERSRMWIAAARSFSTKASAVQMASGRFAAVPRLSASPRRRGESKRTSQASSRFCWISTCSRSGSSRRYPPPGAAHHDRSVYGCTSSGGSKRKRSMRSATRSRSCGVLIFWMSTHG